MSGSPEKVVRGYLEDAKDDLEMADLGAKAGNRLAAYHLQQATEKLVKAVRAHHQLRLTSSHDIEDLVKGNEFDRIDGLPEGDQWGPRLLVFARLSEFATTFRYPSATAGRRKEAPVEQVKKDLRALEQLYADMAKELLE